MHDMSVRRDPDAREVGKRDIRVADEADNETPTLARGLKEKPRKLRNSGNRSPPDWPEWPGSVPEIGGGLISSTGRRAARRPRIG